MAFLVITGGLGSENLALWGPSPWPRMPRVIACNSSSRPKSSISSTLLAAGLLGSAGMGLADDPTCGPADAVPAVESSTGILNGGLMDDGLLLGPPIPSGWNGSDWDGWGRLLGRLPA